MFTADSIQARVRQCPFVPVRIVTTSSEAFDVYDAGLIMIGRREITVGIASVGHPGQYDRVTRVAIVDVAALEGLPLSPRDGDH